MSGGNVLSRDFITYDSIIQMRGGAPGKVVKVNPKNFVVQDLEGKLWNTPRAHARLHPHPEEWVEPDEGPPLSIGQPVKLVDQALLSNYGDHVYVVFSHANPTQKIVRLGGDGNRYLNVSPGNIAALTLEEVKDRL